MRSLRARWPLLLLLVGLLGVGLVAVLLLDEPDSADGTASVTHASVAEGGAPHLAVAVAGGETGTAARLAGRAPSEEDDAGAAPPDAAPGARGGADATSAHALRRKRSRVVDAAGNAVAHARVSLGVVKADGPVTVNLQADAEGRLDLVWPEGRVVRIQVVAPSSLHVEPVVVREDEAGIDPADLDELVLEDLAYLRVLTVDPWRVPRPHQRVLFRSAAPETERTSWWGETSGPDGRLALGPFRQGIVLEVRAGPRGLTAEQVANPAAWKQAVADGREVEVVVPPTARLRLAFHGVAPDATIPITVFDMRTNQPAFPRGVYQVHAGVWTAPALEENLDIGVLVGPLDDGRIGRLTHVVPTEAPVEVRLEPGVVVTGRVLAEDCSAVLAGTVTAYGDGFQVEVGLADGGRYSFPGLPDEPATLVASARPAEGETRGLAGLVRRDRETEMDIRVSPTVHVHGTVLEPHEGGERESRRLAWLGAVSEALPSALQPRIRCGNRIDLDLLAGRWRLRVDTTDGELHAEIDLGDVQEDRGDVVLHLR